MFLLVRSIWPSHKQTEVMEAFNKMPRTPEFVKSLGTYNRPDIEHGFEAYAIFELEAGKENEGLQELSRSMVPFFDIEGFRYRIETVMSVEEAIPMLGL